MHFTIVIDPSGLVTRVATKTQGPATKAEVMRQVRRIKDSK